MGKPNETKATDDGERDASSLRILGMFFVVLSLLVLLGTFWSLSNSRAVIVNLISGGVLLAIGLVMRAAGARIAARN